ncbi:peptidase MA family metallohydrolase [Desulfuromonas sp. TF]|uniref:peptidase MA family metallohydrolase n=1 Tax=Desulfuromonas sp. TF TaxID=1232410 RepID=UPI0003FA5F0C|nr:peptidase MA family metallohydrolase [Desulfuromonas sp. TF]
MNQAFRNSILIILPLLLLTVSVSGALASAPHLLNARGVTLMQKGEYGQAVAPLQKALEGLPYNDAIRGNLAGCFLGLGLQHLEGRRFSQAADALQEGKEYAGEDHRFWLYRGLALLLQGDHGAAEGELHEAQAMDGKDPQVHQLLGRIFYNTGRLYQAIDTWERALELAPEDQETAALLERARRELPVENSMSHDYGRNFKISYNGRAFGEVGDQVLEVLESAYSQIGNDLNFYPDTVVPVLLYTERDFAEITRSPDWAGGLYDGKIRIPVGGVSHMNPQLKAVLFHEYSHVAVHFLTSGRCPVWLNEGLAQIAERRHHDPPLRALAAAVEEDRPLAFEPLEKSFAGLSREEAQLAYEQSYSLTAYMVEQYHWYKMAELLAALGEGLPMGEAVSAVLGEYGVNYVSLQAAWHRQLAKGF